MKRIASTIGSIYLRRFMPLSKIAPGILRLMPFRRSVRRCSYPRDSEWRNRAEFINGRDAIEAIFDPGSRTHQSCSADLVKKEIPHLGEVVGCAYTGAKAEASQKANIR
jgi:hypothetical protein